MNVLKTRAVVLLAAVAIAGTACQGEKGANGTSGTNGANGTYTQALSTSGLQVAVQGTPVVNANQTVSVTFTVKDDQGNPVDLAGKYSTNTAMQPRFSLSQVNVAADGTVLPFTVLTTTGTVYYTTTPPADSSGATFNPTAVAPNPAAPQATGALVENGTGAGNYTYTFGTGGYYEAPGTGSHAGQTGRTFATAVTVDPKSTSTYTIWIEAARQTNLTNTDDAAGFKAVNVRADFSPAGSTVVTREIAATSDCTNCHRGFRPQGSVASAFHSGTRVEAAYCDVCHNPARVSAATNSDGTTPAATSAIYVHRIHASKELLLKITDGTQQTAGYQGSTACTAKAPCTCTVAAPCTPNSFHGISDVTFPQDLRNCDACHKDAAQGTQAKKVANRAVCGSCHDYVVFDPAKVGTLSVCVDQGTGARAKDANGNWMQCVHSAGATTDDNACKGCHVQGGGGNFIGDFHVAVAPPDAGNIFLPQTSGTATAGYQGGASTTCGTGAAACVCTPAAPCFNPTSLSVVTKYTTSGTLLTGGTACGSGHQPSLYSPCSCNSASPCLGAGNNNTNAANLAAAGAVPTGASTFNYVIKSASRNSSKQPVIVFKLQKDGQDAPFDNCTAAATTPTAGNNELYNGFVGSPSLYFVWAVPQDGITTPADFNMSGNAYLRTVCNDGAITKTKISGPDANGYYTVTLTGTTVTDNAVMLTAGVGYTYGLTSTQPLTQINLSPYPYTAATKQGGLTVPAADQSLVATGYTARRAIIDNARCKACHAQLGVNPTFHAGQRNDGATCAWCHNPNRTSSGWAANAKDFIHALHAGSFRNMAFTWHAESPISNFSEITFPGPLNDCTACHLPNTYDFSASASAAALPNLLPSYAATGNFNGDDNTQNFMFSPYVTKVTDATYPVDPRAPLYGFGYSTSKVTVTINDGSVQTASSYTQSVNGTDTACNNTTAFPITATMPNGGCSCTVATPCTYTVKSTCSATTPCDADPSTLVISPVTAACVACHDSPAVKGHIIGNGGLFYVPRGQMVAQATAAIAVSESCLVCHGVGAVAPIADVHR
jgi:OmcA/MtrC family decaheme c-type cytochrome